MSKRRKILGADFFCGAGGTSQGLLMAANRLNADLELIAVNHWQVAIDTHAINHPEQQNLCTGLDEVDPLKLVPGRRLHILCASPECTHHSVARGGKPMDDQSRSSPWLILRWMEKLYIDNVIIENVPEFQSWGPLGVDNRPLASKKGEMFQQWLQMVRSLGYRVEYKVLNCADYGAPTTRRRLFIICRRGNKKIVWPEPTHVQPAAKDASMTIFAESRPAWRTAREIIDWSRESKDIFDRKKPLAPNTLKRIAAGMLKFNGIKIDLEKCIREGLRPYIVVLCGTGNVASVDEPLHTVTASGTHYGLVQPFLLPHRAKDPNCSVERPFNTVTATSSDFALVEPFMLRTDHTGTYSPGVRSVDEPVGTLVTKANTCVVEPVIVTEPDWYPHTDEDGHTYLTWQEKPFLVDPNFGERKGQSPRIRSIDTPAPTVTSTGAGGVVEPFIVPQFGTADARNVDRPLGVVTTTSRGVGLTEPFLATVTHQGGDRIRSVDLPMATVTRSMGDGVAEPCLVEYYGQGGAASVDDPLSTVVTKDRFGLVLPKWISEADQVYRLEIRFRMLQPRELARAQGFEDSYQFTGNREAVVKQIGNAVPPPMAAALCAEVLA